MCSFLLLICGTPAAQKRKWRIPTYGGLTLGKSRKADVERTLGRPEWSGPPEDEYDNPIESMLSYSYENVGGFQGRTVIWMKARSGVVTDILLYPSSERPLTLKELVSKEGRDYIERDAALGPCPTAKEIRKLKGREEGRGECQYPIFLVYPEKGMIVLFDDKENVQEISYMLRCS